MVRRKGGVLILTIIQARLGSTRLPGKILLPIAGKPILQHVYDAAPEPKILAVPESDFLQINDKRLMATCAFSGDADDVLGRFWYAYEWSQQATKHRIDWILRLTADCPMLTREIVAKFIRNARPFPIPLKGNIGEFCVSDKDTIYTNRPWDPDGYDMELFSVEALRMAHELATDPHDREHVTFWLYKHLNVRRFSVFGRESQPENPEEKVSVDTMEDYEKVKKLMEGK